MSNEPKITRSLTRGEWEAALLDVVADEILLGETCGWSGCDYFHPLLKKDAPERNHHTGDCPCAEEPVDRERCQAERVGPFMFGPGMNRCDRAPVWIAREAEPGEDGLRGEMSLCLECAQVLRKMGATRGKVKLTPLLAEEREEED